MQDPAYREVPLDDAVADVGDAAIPVVTEAEMADHLRRQGRRVVQHRGRPWQEELPGFYRPVHPLARLSRPQATLPTLRCWGFQACLTDDDAGSANAASPMYVVSDLAPFEEAALPQSRRYKLRKSRRRAHLVQLTGPALLRDQGYDVLRSAHGRTGYGTLPTREEYLASLEGFAEPARGIVLAGLVDGRLGGYLTGYAVDGTAYVRNVVIGADGLGADLGTGLTYEFLFACRRASGITEVAHGWHVPEDPGLCRHKDWLGLAVRRVPSRIRLVPGAAAVIRRRRPHAYYRLTGDPSAVPAPDPAPSDAT